MLRKQSAMIHKGKPQSMTLRKIVTLPEAILRRKARAVTKVDKNLQSLIDDMVETMRDAPGVGLAAPQIGLSERLIVIEYYERPADEEKEDAPKKVWAVINPEIVKASEETSPAGRMTSQPLRAGSGKNSAGW